MLGEITVEEEIHQHTRRRGQCSFYLSDAVLHGVYKKAPSGRYSRVLMVIIFLMCLSYAGVMGYMTPLAWHEKACSPDTISAGGAANDVQGENPLSSNTFCDIIPFSFQRCQFEENDHLWKRNTSVQLQQVISSLQDGEGLVDQVVFILVDALRPDYVLPGFRINSSNGHCITSPLVEWDNERNVYVRGERSDGQDGTHEVVIPFLQRAMLDAEDPSIGFFTLADSPTTTTQRVKALATGTMPSLLDAVFQNFHQSRVAPSVNTWGSSSSSSSGSSASGASDGDGKQRMSTKARFVADSRRTNNGEVRDSLLWQLKGRAAYVGDDTWGRLFPPAAVFFTSLQNSSSIPPHKDDHPTPNHIYAPEHDNTLSKSGFPDDNIDEFQYWRQAIGTYSFDVSDYHSVDDLVEQHIFRLLDEEKPEPHKTNESMPYAKLIIGHFLGLDHIGHHQGRVDTTEMRDKAMQANALLERISFILQHRLSRTLLIVAGDHGVTAHGNHGGGSAIERTTFAYAKFFSGAGGATNNSLVLTPSQKRHIGSLADERASAGLEEELMHLLTSCRRPSHTSTVATPGAEADLFSNHHDASERKGKPYRFIPSAGAKHSWDDRRGGTEDRLRQHPAPSPHKVSASYQVDWTASIALVLGVPIPSDNVGRVIPEVLHLVLPELTDEEDMAVVIDRLEYCNWQQVKKLQSDGGSILDNRLDNGIAPPVSAHSSSSISSLDGRPGRKRDTSSDSEVSDSRSAHHAPTVSSVPLVSLPSVAMPSSWYRHQLASVASRVHKEINVSFTASAAQMRQVLGLSLVLLMVGVVVVFGPFFALPPKKWRRLFPWQKWWMWPTMFSQFSSIGVPLSIAILNNLSGVAYKEDFMIFCYVVGYLLMRTTVLSICEDHDSPFGVRQSRRRTFLVSALLMALIILSFASLRPYTPEETIPEASTLELLARQWADFFFSPSSSSSSVYSAYSFNDFFQVRFIDLLFSCLSKEEERTWDGFHSLIVTLPWLSSWNSVLQCVLCRLQLYFHLPYFISVVLFWGIYLRESPGQMPVWSLLVLISMAFLCGAIRTVPIVHHMIPMILALVVCLSHGIHQMGRHWLRGNKTISTRCKKKDGSRKLTMTMSVSEQKAPQSMENNVKKCKLLSAEEEDGKLSSFPFSHLLLYFVMVLWVVSLYNYHGKQRTPAIVISLYGSMMPFYILHFGFTLSPFSSSSFQQGTLIHLLGVYGFFVVGQQSSFETIDWYAASVGFSSAASRGQSTHLGPSCEGEDLVDTRASHIGCSLGSSSRWWRALADPPSWMKLGVSGMTIFARVFSSILLVLPAYAVSYGLFLYRRERHQKKRTRNATALDIPTVVHTESLKDDPHFYFHYIGAREAALLIVMISLFGSTIGAFRHYGNITFVHTLHIRFIYEIAKMLGFIVSFVVSECFFSSLLA